MTGPGVYITMKEKKQFDYPLLELIDILKGFECSIWNKDDVERAVGQFLTSLAYKNNISTEENDHLVVYVKMGSYGHNGKFSEWESGEVFVEIGNLFTACMLYEYVPMFILSNNYEWKYRDCTIVKSNGHGYDIIEKGIEIKPYEATEAEKIKTIENLKIYNEKAKTEILKKVEYPYSGTYNEKLEYLKSNLELCRELKPDEIFECTVDGDFTLFSVDGKFYVRNAGGRWWTVDKDNNEINR